MAVSKGRREPGEPGGWGEPPAVGDQKQFAQSTSSRLMNKQSPAVMNFSFQAPTRVHLAAASQQIWKGGSRARWGAWGWVYTSSGSVPASGSQARGGRGGRTLGARSLPWKCCWHRHFPSSLSSLSIHSTAGSRVWPGRKTSTRPCALHK